MFRAEVIAKVAAGRGSAATVTESARRVDFWSRRPGARPERACYVLESGKVREVFFVPNVRPVSVVGLAWLERGRWHGLIDDGSGYVVAGAHDELHDCVRAIFSYRDQRRRSLQVVEMPTDPEAQLALRVRNFDWEWFQSDDYDGARRRAEESMRTIYALGVRIGLDRAHRIFAQNAPEGQDNPFEPGQESA